MTDPTDDEIRTVRGQALAMATLCDVALSSREKPAGATCSRTEARAAVARYLAGLRDDKALGEAFSAGAIWRARATVDDDAGDAVAAYVAKASGR